MICCTQLYLGCFHRRTGVSHENLKSERTPAHIDAVQPARHLFGHLVDERLRLLVVLEANPILEYIVSSSSHGSLNTDRHLR